MKILLLSVLAIAMIGLMIPSVFGLTLEERDYYSMNFSIMIPSEWEEEFLGENILELKSSFETSVYDGPFATLLVFYIPSYDESIDNFERLINLKKDNIPFDNIRIIDKSTVTEGDFTKTYATLAYELGNDTSIGKIILVTHNHQMWIIELMSLEDSIFYTSQSFHALYDTLKDSFTVLGDSPPEIAKITSAYLIQGEPYNLLVFEMAFYDGPFAHMPALSDYGSSFLVNDRNTAIFTQDFTFIGTTVPKNIEWDETCPVYVSKTAYPDMPIIATLCFEVPKSESTFKITHASELWKADDMIIRLESSSNSVPKESMPQPESQPKFENDSKKLTTCYMPDPSYCDNEQYEIDMGISIRVPESWDAYTAYNPATGDDYAMLESSQIYLNAHQEITIFYYGDRLSYSDLSDEQKLEEIMKFEERLHKEQVPVSFQNTLSLEFISTSIEKDEKTTTFYLEFETLDESGILGGDKIQMFEVHSDKGIWGIYLKTDEGFNRLTQQSAYELEISSTEVFNTLKNSFTILGYENMDSSKSSVSIPEWIKGNAGWWADGQIDDNSFVQGIQFMIKENIISIPNLPESSSETTESVPAWVKNNAGWWADGQIDDNSFVKGIEYLVKVGIIQVS